MLKKFLFLMIFLVIFGCSKKSEIIKDKNEKIKYIENVIKNNENKDSMEMDISIELKNEKNENANNFIMEGHLKEIKSSKISTMDIKIKSKSFPEIKLDFFSINNKSYFKIPGSEKYIDSSSIDSNLMFNSNLINNADIIENINAFLMNIKTNENILEIMKIGNENILLQLDEKQFQEIKNKNNAINIFNNTDIKKLVMSINLNKKLNYQKIEQNYTYKENENIIEMKFELNNIKFNHIEKIEIPEEIKNIN